MAVRYRLAAAGVVAVASLCGAATTAGAAPISELVERISLDAMRAHVAALAGQRTTPAEQAAAAAYIAGQLTAAGYDVVRLPVGNGDNLVARAVGRTDPGAAFVIGAHYDSVFASPGADDNAASVAALLEIARVLSDVELGASVELVAFADEELGLQGSRRYARATRDALRDVIGMMSLEMIAYTCARPGCQIVFPNLPDCLAVSNPNANVGTFIAAVGNDASAALLHDFVAAAARYVPDLTVETGQVAGLGSCLPDTRRSDHLPYWQEGYPALMVTDTANYRNPNYHRPGDLPETLDFPFALRVARAVLGTALDAAGLAPSVAPSPTPTAPPPPPPPTLPAGARRVLFIGRNADRFVNVVDLDQPTAIESLSIGRSPDLMALSPDRRTLYVLSRETDLRREDGGVTIADVTGARPPLFIPLGAPTSLAVSPDGGRLYVTNHPYGPERTFEVIDTTTACRSTILSIDSATGYLSGMRLTSDGGRGYVADGERDRVLILDPLSPRLEGSFDIGSPLVRDFPVALELDAADAVAYVVNGSSGTVSMLDVASGAIIKNVLVHNGSRAVALTPDGTVAVVAACCSGDDRAIDLVDTRSRRAFASLVPPDDVYPDSVAIGPEGLTAYVTGCGGQTLVVDLPSRTITDTIARGECIAPLLAAVLPPGTPPPRPTPLADCPTPRRIDVAATATTSPTPAPTPTRTAAPCAGDCDANQEVTIDELLRAVGIALDVEAIASCTAADADGSGQVTVTELIRAVHRALTAC
ncbi:MAG: M28 family peptidase [Candidatus Binatia bacterium]